MCFLVSSDSSNLIDSKLPNPLYSQEQQPEICLIVKDVNKKERDYDPSVRKYQRLVDKHNLGAVIKQVIYHYTMLVDFIYSICQM